MALLDFAIRDTPPPLSQPFVLAGRISFLILTQTIVILVFYLDLFRRFGFPAFVAYILLQISLSILEAFMSNRYGDNIARLRRAGYSDGIILFYQEFNRVGSQYLAYILVNYIATDETIYTFDYLFHSFGIIGMFKLVVNLAVTEVLFWAGHRLMHTHDFFLKLHVFHHCSIYPSWNTNLLFHPIDLAIEFSAPALSLLAMHHFVWNLDQCILLYSYVVFQLWYAYNHDEHLGLYHADHHVKTDSLYVVYSKVKDSGKYNLLKHYMAEKGLLKENGKE